MVCLVWLGKIVDGVEGNRKHAFWYGMTECIANIVEGVLPLTICITPKALGIGMSSRSNAI